MANRFDSEDVDTPQRSRGFLGGLGQAIGRIGRPRRAKDESGYEAGRNGEEITEAALRQRVDGWLGEAAKEKRQVAARVRFLSKQVSDDKLLFTFVGWMLAGFGVFLGAMIVDYQIISEIWERILSNKYLQVPASLVDNVFFKSAQVAFATLAFHYILKIFGGVFRPVVGISLTAMALVMLLGFGIIAAMLQLPQGSTLFGVPIQETARETVDDTLAALGLGTPAAPSASAGAAGDAPITEDELRTYQTVVWVVSIGLIFMIVTGVGAFSLLYGISGYKGIAGMWGADGIMGMVLGSGEDNPLISGSRRRLLEEYGSRLEELRDLSSARRLLVRVKGRISEFVESYREGLRASRLADDDRKEMLTAIEDAAAAVSEDLAEKDVADLIAEDRDLEELKPRRRGVFGWVKGIFGGRRRDEDDDDDDEIDRADDGDNVVPMRKKV